ncbi:MAG: GTP cyclohydrolase II [Planctomycetota bacterium]|jgi:3,4-dihydroxy 2-butanone 4-phosphate synthase/GTP cyclohydrolase II|nr:GTP cyclohydrolase II [Planctomycetota bacterium]MDP7253902.1 GTP cyclohydrolase II [Planctomycetota bacterium]
MAAKRNISEIPDLIRDLKKGKPIVLLDSDERDAGGDVLIAAECITARQLNSFAREAGGMIGLALTAEKCDQLHLLPSFDDPESQATAMTMTIDARRFIKSGLSATDRVTTIKTALADDASPTDFRKPGHVHPLRARRGGVLVRAGTTEASIDLVRLAGMKPAAVICSIMDSEGEVAQMKEVLSFARKHRFKAGTITDVISHRIKSEDLIQRMTHEEIQNEHGTFNLISYYSQLEDQAHYVLCKGDIGRPRGNGNPIDRPLLVRVHSECLTGDVLHSQRCDCGQQFASALKMIEKEGEGILVYLRQEGRGIGLINKLRAYKLQELGRDTVEANEELGFPADRRDYGIGWQILKDLGARKLRLITNNPAKIYGLEAYGLEITKRVQMPVKPNKSNLRYLETKKQKLGHLIEY